MYERFFGLKERPFNLTPDPRFFYESLGHQEALAHLVYGVQERKGFVLLTAEVGLGKTLLLRAFLERLGEEVRTAYLFNSRMSFPQLLRSACADFGLPVNGQGKAALLMELNQFLVEGFVRGENAVLIIDEAQNLSAAALEEIRLLSNVETSEAKLLQIVLAGQPELEARLAQPSLRQLRQRIGLHARLSPLGKEETRAYIQRRLEVAGAEDISLFTDRALDEIYRHSRGVPRLINLLCDRALLAAYAEGQRPAGPATVREVAQELGWKRGKRGGRKRALVLALASALLLSLSLGAGAYRFRSHLWAKTGARPLAPIPSPSLEEGPAPTVAPQSPQEAAVPEGGVHPVKVSPNPQPLLEEKASLRRSSETDRSVEILYKPAVVRWVQEVLSKSGHYRGELTGRLDEATREALRAFQREKGLDPVGLPGPLTRAALQEYEGNGGTR